MKFYQTGKGSNRQIAVSETRSTTGWTVKNNQIRTEFDKKQNAVRFAEQLSQTGPFSSTVTVLPRLS